MHADFSYLHQLYQRCLVWPTHDGALSRRDARRATPACSWAAYGLVWRLSSMVLSTVQHWRPVATYGDGPIDMVGAAVTPHSCLPGSTAR